MFKRPTVIAHGVVLNEDERAFLAENDVRVAHNPNSNLKLGSGIANVKAMLEAGIKVGIATDSVASNNNLDMFEEMRIATLLQKGIHQDATALPVETALTLATKGAAEVIGMKQTGSLEIENVLISLRLIRLISLIYNQRMKCYHTLYMLLVEKI